MRNRFTMLLSIAVLALFMGCAAQKGIRTASPVDLNPKMSSGQYVQKVDSFAVIFDATESMNDFYKSNTKLNQERKLLALFDKTIPNLKLTAVERAFGQFSVFSDATTKVVYGPTAYAKSGLTSAIEPLTGNGLSPLNAAIDGAAKDLQNASGQLAVIAFSDGEDMDRFKPVAAAQRLKSAYGDRVCIYTVHLGDNLAGRKMMQQVADASGCGFMAKGDEIATPQGMANFVEKVFLKAYVAPPKPVVAPAAPVKERVAEMKPQAQAAPKVVAKEPVTIDLNIEFATGKSIIRPKYNNEIKKVGDFMKEHPNTKAVIEGHTDNVGKEAANVKLSQNRANAVKKALVSKFKIDASRLEAIGYGPKKPIASNSTKAGKQKNRRVHAVISEM